MLITFSVNPEIHADILTYISTKTQEHGGNQSEALRAIIRTAIKSQDEEQRMLEVISEIKTSTQQLSNQIKKIRHVEFEDNESNSEEPQRAELSPEIKSTLLAMKRRGQRK